MKAILPASIFKCLKGGSTEMAEEDITKSIYSIIRKSTLKAKSIDASKKTQ